MIDCILSVFSSVDEQIVLLLFSFCFLLDSFCSDQETITNQMRNECREAACIIPTRQLVRGKRSGSESMIGESEDVFRVYIQMSLRLVDREKGYTRFTVPFYQHDHCTCLLFAFSVASVRLSIPHLYPISRQQQNESRASISEHSFYQKMCVDRMFIIQL